MNVSRRQTKAQLKEGGQRVFQQAQAEIFDKDGPRLERQTGAGMKTHVHQLLDPRLAITDTQRAVGNYYGALVQELQSGGSSEFMREYVDTSTCGGGGYSENRVHKAQMVKCAYDGLREMEPFTYPKGKSRNEKFILGEHRKIKPFHMADLVCVNQRTLSQVALAFQWTRIPIQNGKWGRPKVPDRQRKALADALRNTLDAVGDAWATGGFNVPYHLFTVTVR